MSGAAAVGPPALGALPAGRYYVEVEARPPGGSYKLYVTLP